MESWVKSEENMDQIQSPSSSKYSWKFYVKKKKLDIINPLFPSQFPINKLVKDSVRYSVSTWMYLLKIEQVNSPNAIRKYYETFLKTVQRESNASANRAC